MNDPTRDTEPTPHHWGGTDEPMEGEYAAAKRREAEKKQPALVYCKHMDMDIYEGTCAICTPPPPEPTMPNGTRTLAHYSGQCPACEWGIEPGEVITLVDGAWVHIEHWEGTDA